MVWYRPKILPGKRTANLKPARLHSHTPKSVCVLGGNIMKRQQFKTFHMVLTCFLDFFKDSVACIPGYTGVPYVTPGPPSSTSMCHHVCLDRICL